MDVHPSIRELRATLKGIQVRGQNEAVNMVRLGGGKYNLLPKFRAKFFQLWERAMPHFAADNFECLTYRPPPEDDQPLYIDIDLLLKAEVPLKCEPYALFASRVAAHISNTYGHETVEFVVVSKEKGYWKKKNGNDVFCCSAHIYFVAHLFSSEDASAIRTASLCFCDEAFGPLGPINSNDDIVDDHVVSRANGLIFPGSFKARRPEAGQYTAKLFGRYEDGDTETKALTKGDFYRDFSMAGIFRLRIREPARGPWPSSEKPAGEKGYVQSRKQQWVRPSTVPRCTGWVGTRTKGLCGPSHVVLQDRT